MTTAGSVTIDRSALSLPSLIIGGTQTSQGIYLASDGLTAVSRTFSRLIAQSPDFHGGVAYSATLEPSALPMHVYAASSTTAGVKALLDSLTQAVQAQWSYDVTVAVDGTTQTWSCSPGDVTPDPWTAPFVDAHVLGISLSLPIDIPVPS
ncbi:MAG TPA: hypothetical protein VN088_16265 [Nocardioides sp.]|nr:hypothetical protein [Nocardioides sp.]